MRAPVAAEPAAEPKAGETAGRAAELPWQEPATRRLCRYLRCLRCPRDLAEDFAQEALLAATRVFGRQPPPLPWLFTAARNQWFAHCRVRRPQLLGELDHLHAAAVQELGDDGGDERLELLRQCIASLPLRSRLALQLCYRDGLSRGEIGARLGLGDNGTKTLLARLRAALKQCVERRSHGHV
jgi:RNA polymerase sigma factor (sigma-70 family)